MSKGGQNTTTSSTAIDPQIMSLITGNVNRATGIADKPFQAYTGDPYAGTGKAATPGTEGYTTPDTYNYQTDSTTPGVYMPGTPGTPAQAAATFDPSKFVSPLTANENTAINAAGNAGGAGAGAINAGIQGAAGLLGYTPQNVNPATANADYADAYFLGGAPRAKTTNATAAGYNPSLLGGAPTIQAANANSAAAGPTSTAAFGPAGVTNAGAASINRGDVGNVGANSGLGGIAGYQNPYTDQVVNAALGDIDLQRQRAIGGNTDAAIGAGAFGGSRQGVADSLTNEAYGRQAAQTAAQLRQAGFDQAAQLSQQDAARAQQGQAANQAVDLSVAGQNAGFGQQTGLTNANAANNIGLANAQGLFGASQFNAGAANDTSKFNAANDQQANLTNAGAENAARAANAGYGAQYDLNNQGAQNQAGAFNATNNQSTGIFNAANANDTSKFNTGLLGDFAKTNNATANANSILNAGIANDNSKFNAGTINDAAARNQSAGLAGAGVNAGAAGLLGTLGGQQQDQVTNFIQQLLGTGGLQQNNNQAGLDAAYNEFLRSIGYPIQGQSLINQSLGLLPQGGGTTTTTSPKPDNTGGILSGLGSIASAAALLSDERTKTDIQTVGYDEQGRRWTTWRYNWEPPHVQHFGLIAQEAQMIDPQAVLMNEQGYFCIDYTALTRH